LDLTDEKQIPEIFANLEAASGEKGFPRALVDYLKNTIATMSLKINVMSVNFCVNSLGIRKY